MNNETSYVRVDEHGVYRVGRTRVMLDSIIAAFRDGHSAETIRQQYPALTLEEVYGSIAFYLAHNAEVESYLKRQNDLWEQWQASGQGQPSPVVDRLRALLRAGVRSDESPAIPGRSRSQRAHHRWRAAPRAEYRIHPSSRHRHERIIRLRYPR